MIKIYMYINKINNKVYIGQTSQTLERRAKKGKGYKASPRFYNAILKYGWENFEPVILHEESDPKNANYLETEEIKKYKSRDINFGYNLSEGGGEYFYKKGYIPWNKGKKMKPLSEEHKEKIRQANLGKKRPYKKREPLSEECKKKISLSNTGKKRTAEMIELNRQIHLGRTATEISKTKCSKTMIENNPVYIKGESLKDNSVLYFKSPVEASNFLGLANSSGIINCCRGRYKSSGGFSWSYINKEEYINNNFLE